MINIEVYRDEGTITGGRGTPILVDDFNMKDSAVYSVEYFPTKETTGAPLVRPTLAGDQDLSYPVYTFFKLSGDTEKIKNLRIMVSNEEDGEADGAQLFYKLTNVYGTPAASYDGDMILLSNNGVMGQTEFWPMLSLTGPQLATSRATTYTLATGVPLFTNYFVTQMRINKGSSVGNTAEFKLKFSVQEFE